MSLAQISVVNNAVTVNVGGSDLFAGLAAASAASALASKNAAETAETNAETAETNAEAARDAAEAFAAASDSTTRLSKAANLSDLVSAQTARENVGLRALPQAQIMWARIRGEGADVNWGIFSDSTGTGTDRHVYRTTLLLAADMPTHTVVYKAWNDGAQSWDADVVIQTGTGARTFNVWNFAISGTNLEHVEAGARAVILLNAAATFDLVTINYGHNSGTNLSERDYVDEMRVGVVLAQSTARDGGVIVTLQNPRRDTGGYAHTKRMAAGWRAVALEYGCGVIDVLTPFEALGAAQGDYYGDTIHPNSAGSILWSQIEYAAMKEAKSVPLLSSPASVGHIPRVNRCPNPAFATWASSTPSSWTFTDTVPIKNPTYAVGGLYGLTVTHTGNAPSMTVDLSAFLTEWRGKTITMHARVWKPTGLGENAGRVSLYANNGVLTPQSTAWTRGASTGGWYDSTVSFTVPRDTGYSTLTGKIFLGGTGDTGEQMHVAWVSVHEGTGPNVFDPSWVVGQAITDQFSASAIGSATGTASAVGNTVSVTGISATTVAFFHNLLTLTTGRQYKISWGAITGSGFTFGTIFARTGSGSGGGTGTIASVGNSTGQSGSLTFTAPGGACMIRIDTNSGTTSLSIPTLTIELVPEPVYLPLFSARSDNGTVLDAAGATGNFKVVGTVGTSLYLQGQDAQNNTKTDAAVYEFTLPSTYVAGVSPTLIVNAHYAVVSGAGTAGTKTIDAFAYEIASAGTAGSDLVTTSVQTLTTSAADYSFVITGTGLKAGERLQIRLLGAIQETANGGAFATRINSVRLTNV